MTWEFFKRSFEAKYIGPAYFEKRKQEFLSLRQGSMTPQEYEREFARLSSYAPELVPTEETRCARFRYGLDAELHTAVAPFQDTVFDILRGRVLSVAESRICATEMSEQEKSSGKRPADSSGASGFSKKAKESQLSGRSGSHQSRRSGTGFRPQPAASVASTGGSAGQRGLPKCGFCRRYHSGECWRKTGGCLRCGSMEHIVRDCPRVGPSASVQQSAQVTSAGRGTGSAVGGSGRGGGGPSGRG